MPLKDPKPIQEKIESLYSHLQALYEYDHYIDVVTINRVGFAAEPNHPETARLRNKYIRLTRKITAIYSRDDWFEQTLGQLISE